MLSLHFSAGPGSKRDSSPVSYIVEDDSSSDTYSEEHSGRGRFSGRTPGINYSPRKPRTSSSPGNSGRARCVSSLSSSSPFPSLSPLSSYSPRKPPTSLSPGNSGHASCVCSCLPSVVPPFPLLFPSLFPTPHGNDGQARSVCAPVTCSFFPPLFFPLSSLPSPHNLLYRPHIQRYERRQCWLLSPGKPQTGFQRDDVISFCLTFPSSKM